MADSEKGKAKRTLDIEVCKDLIEREKALLTRVGMSISQVDHYIRPMQVLLEQMIEEQKASAGSDFLAIHKGRPEASC